MDERKFRISPRFSYVVTKSIDGIDGGGSTAWWGCRAAKTFGHCSEALCPSSTLVTEEEFVNAPISASAYFAGYGLRTQYYQRLFTVEDCMYAIFNNGGIQVSFDCFEDIYSTKDGYIHLPNVGEKANGSHSVMVYGYSMTDKVFKFVNSWGESWGSKGHGTLPFSYFEEGLVSEAWASVIYGKPTGDEKVIILKNSLSEKFKICVNIWKPLRSTKHPLVSFDIYSSKNIMIGFIHVSCDDELSLEIEDLYILPDYQSLGFGTATLKQLENNARKDGIRKIIGWVSTQDIIGSREKSVLDFLTFHKYKVVRDNTHYRDSYYKFEKVLSS